MGDLAVHFENYLAKVFSGCKMTTLDEQNSS